MLQSTVRVYTKPQLMQYYNEVLRPQLRDAGLTWVAPFKSWRKDDIITALETIELQLDEYAAAIALENNQALVTNDDFEVATEWYPVQTNLPGLPVRFYGERSASMFYLTGPYAIFSGIHPICYPNYIDAMCCNPWPDKPFFTPDTAYPACPVRLPEVTEEPKTATTPYDPASDYVEWYEGIGLDSANATEWYPVYLDRTTGTVNYYTDTWTQCPTRAALAMLESYDLIHYPSYHEAICHNDEFPSLSADTAFPACPLHPITLPVNADVDSMPPIDTYRCDCYIPVRIVNDRLEYFAFCINDTVISHYFFNEASENMVTFSHLDHAQLYRNYCRYSPTHILYACRLTCAT